MGDTVSLDIMIYLKEIKKMDNEFDTFSYYRKSSFWTVLTASVLFCIDKHISINLAICFLIIAGSLVLGFIFGKIITMIFGYYITKDYAPDSIIHNYEQITALKIKIRYISIVSIFIITVVMLNLLFV